MAIREEKQAIRTLANRQDVIVRQVHNLGEDVLTLIDKIEGLNRDVDVLTLRAQLVLMLGQYRIFKIK